MIISVMEVTCRMSELNAAWAQKCSLDDRPGGRLSDLQVVVKVKPTQSHGPCTMRMSGTNVARRFIDAARCAILVLQCLASFLPQRKAEHR